MKNYKKLLNILIIILMCFIRINSIDAKGINCLYYDDEKKNTVLLTIKNRLWPFNDKTKVTATVQTYNFDKNFNELSTNVEDWDENVKKCPKYIQLSSNIERIQGSSKVYNNFVIKYSNNKSALSKGGFVLGLDGEGVENDNDSSSDILKCTIKLQNLNSTLICTAQDENSQIKCHINQQNDEKVSFYNTYYTPNRDIFLDKSGNFKCPEVVYYHSNPGYDKNNNYSLIITDISLTSDDSSISSESIEGNFKDDSTIADITTCDDIPATMELIKKVYNFLKYLIPVIIIGLGILDFVKVVLSDDSKVFKDAWSRLLKRIIIGVVILILPAILTLIINMSGVIDNQGLNSNDIFCIFS